MNDLGLLVLRVSSGLFMAFGHGLKKLPPSEGLINNAGKMGFPFPELFAWSASFAEFFASLLIVLGVFVRPAAFLWICTMGTAAFIAHADDDFGTKEKALLYLAIGMSLLLTGGGKYSLSNILFKKKHALL